MSAPLKIIGIAYDMRSVPISISTGRRTMGRTLVHDDCIEVHRTALHMSHSVQVGSIERYLKISLSRISECRISGRTRVRAILDD